MIIAICEFYNCIVTNVVEVAVYCVGGLLQVVYLVLILYYNGMTLLGMCMVVAMVVQCCLVVSCCFFLYLLN
jgi:hypothetical protein